MPSKTPKLKINIKRPPARERLHLFIRKDTKVWLEKIAAQHNVSLGSVVDELVEAAK